MANTVNILKTVYNSAKHDTIVDKEFKTFVPPTDIRDSDTVEELFRIYEKVYYSIPAEGEIQSHRYLLDKSLEIVDYKKNLEEIEPLLNEIAQLRSQLLSANQQILDLEINNI